jgi:hypothetical protein
MMNTITIQLKNQKAYKLLEDMEALNLIRVLKESPKISSIRSQVKTRMSNEDIDTQLNAIRKEWQRDS